MICDPEAEYWPLVKRLHGQVIKISPTSKQYVNPMDLSLDYSDDDNPLSLKVDFILSFCDIVVGSKEGLKPVEKTIIDRCVRMVYRDYLADPRPENMPILQDLYDCLRAQDEKEAQFWRPRWKSTSPVASTFSITGRMWTLTTVLFATTSRNSASS